MSWASIDCEIWTLAELTNDLKIDTCHLLVKSSALLGYGKDWLTKFQDNVTEWGIRSWCWQPDPPMWQHYKVIMSVHIYMYTHIYIYIHIHMNIYIYTCITFMFIHIYVHMCICTCTCTFSYICAYIRYAKSCPCDLRYCQDVKPLCKYA